MVFGLFFVLAVVLSVLACCLCCWMGDTLIPVSLYSHAWELTILTNRLMTVRASSAHGTAQKKNCQPNEARCFARKPQHCLAHQASYHWLRRWFPPGMYAAIQPSSSVDGRG